ncbi:glycosyltransferase [Nocardioides sp. HDW12B]|uniref:glycosyltransferase n=1 Tax=Nocardioides sp. HDW12B TaxID=2714939 RepID=UPI0023F9C574|nr:glycosyltransferase [Nocardioides sp. HDW12B]
MAVYNCCETVGRAVESIFDQTYQNWELVICDDASTDDTPLILADLVARSAGRVRLIRNDVNSKLSLSLNRCLAEAQGELIARMDGDDISAPNRFQLQVDHLAAHPEIDVVGTAMQRFDATGKHDVVTLPPEPTKYAMRAGVPFAHATIMMRRAAYESLGGYTVSERTVRGQDYDLWFRFFAAGFSGHNLPAPLYLVREDTSALKRRTLKVRWATFQTSIIGYSLLGFPRYWLARPAISLVKAFVPWQLAHVWRKYQARIALKSTTSSS